MDKAKDFKFCTPVDSPLASENLTFWAIVWSCCVILSSAVLTQYRRVTDTQHTHRQSDSQTDRQMTAACTTLA